MGLLINRISSIILSMDTIIDFVGEIGSLKNMVKHRSNSYFQRRMDSKLRSIKGYKTWNKNIWRQFIRKYVEVWERNMLKSTILKQKNGSIISIEGAREASLHCQEQGGLWNYPWKCATIWKVVWSSAQLATEFNKNRCRHWKQGKAIVPLMQY